MLMGVKIFEKNTFWTPATIRQKRVHYVVKKRIFNKKCLFIVLCKIRFLKCNTLQDTSGVRGIDSEVSQIWTMLNRGRRSCQTAQTRQTNPLFDGSPLWVAPYSDLICVNPIFCLINKVKSYGNKFKRSEVRMTGGN